MGDVAAEIDLRVIPARLRRVAVYALAVVLAAVAWWFFLPVLRASTNWAMVESIAVWAPIAAVVVAIILELARANQTRAFLIVEYLIGLCLLASFAHFILAALRFGEVQSITMCCGYSKLISVSQNPLGYWMYVGLLCLLAFGAAVWVVVRYTLARKDER